jgi:hypothetical protein
MQNLPQFVLNRLRQTTVSPDSHPDTNQLTAFAERSLAASERARLLAHLALCGDCRDIVATALPGMEAVSVPASAVGRSRFRWPTLRWVALAAGILAVTTFGIEQFGQHRPPGTVASNVNLGPAVMPANSPVTPAATQSDGAEERAAKRHPGKGGQMASRTLQLDRAERERALPQSPARPEQSAIVANTGSANPTPSDPTPSDPAPSDQAPSDQDQIAQNTNPAIPGHSVVDLDIVKAKDPVPLETSSGMPQWSITSAGALQRSYDDGKSWENISPTANIAWVFRAVASAGFEVWAGGSAGALFHTTDGGMAWTRITPSASGTTLTSDITSIEFSDPQHASIATSNAERWTTPDGGQTWLREPRTQ